MSDDFHKQMMAAMRDGTGYVEVDVEPPHTSANLRVASEMAERRMHNIKNGDRVAYLYTHEHDAMLAPTGHRQFVLATGLTLEQARQLIEAGAKWVGPAHQAPPPR